MQIYNNEAQKQYSYMEEMKEWVKAQEERLGRLLPVISPPLAAR